MESLHKVLDERLLKRVHDDVVADLETQIKAWQEYSATLEKRLGEIEERSLRTDPASALPKLLSVGFNVKASDIDPEHQTYIISHKVLGYVEILYKTGYDITERKALTRAKATFVQQMREHRYRAGIFCYDASGYTTAGVKVSFRQGNDGYAAFINATNPDLYVVQAMIDLYNFCRRRVHKRHLDEGKVTVPTDQLVLRDSLEKLGPYAFNLLKRLRVVEKVVTDLDKRGTFTELTDLASDLTDPVAIGPDYQQTLNDFATTR